MQFCAAPCAQLISPLGLHARAFSIGLVPPRVLSHTMRPATMCARTFGPPFSTSSTLSGAIAPTAPSVAAASVASLSSLPDLAAVDTAIFNVEREINAVALQLQTPGLAKHEMLYLRKKELRLCQKESQLRHKESQLRQQTLLEMQARSHHSSSMMTWSLLRVR